MHAGLTIAQTSMATPPASSASLERARIEAERQKMFDPNNLTLPGAAGKLPSATAIEREMKKVDLERKEMFDVNNPATKPVPNVFPNVATPARSKVDLEEMARRYEHKALAQKVDALMVFASFSMPKESLKRLVSDTARAGGVVVLRGFKDGSIRSTGIAINDLGEAGGGVQINPNAFIKYRISSVPSVVLVKADGAEQVDVDGCALADQYVSISGDVGLGYALQEVERQSPKFGEMAARYARPLKGRTQ